MKSTLRAILLVGVVLGLGLRPPACRAGQYTNFTVAVYTVVNTVRQLAQHPEDLTNQWQRLTNQLKVDKVYIAPHSTLD